MIDRAKVLHVLWSGHSGGAERLVRDITVYYNRSIFEHQVCFLSSGGRFGRVIAEHGTPVHSLGMKGGFSIKKGYGLRKVLKSFKPDIIQNHSRNFLASFLILSARNASKIYFEHGGDLISDRPGRDVLFYSCFVRFYELVLANSEYIKQRIAGLNRVDPQNVRTFYIGIDPTEYRRNKNRQQIRRLLNIDSHKKVIGVVCRLVEQKGLDDFLKVAHEIQKIRRDGIFLIVGEGKERAILEKTAAQYDVDMRFLGDRSDVPDLLSIFDIFLFTSRSESFGIVLLEAMAARVPVLGFAVGGAKEIIDKGGGVLLEERNHKKLATLIVEVLEDRVTYERLSAQGYANVIENFHIKKSIELLEKEYLALLP